MKGDHILTRMVIVFKWETGDVFRSYSPKKNVCQSRFKKWLGSLLMGTGGEILFGKKGWMTYKNCLEEDGDSVSK